MGAAVSLSPTATPQVALDLEPELPLHGDAPRSMRISLAGQLHAPAECRTATDGSQHILLALQQGPGALPVQVQYPVPPHLAGATPRLVGRLQRGDWAIAVGFGLVLAGSGEQAALRLMVCERLVPITATELFNPSNAGAHSHVHG